EAAVASRARGEATDDDAGLTLRLETDMLVSGLIRMRAGVTNTAAGIFDLHSLDLTLPVPTEAEEILDVTGRWGRERALQRHDFTHGTHLRENRRARALDVSSLTAVGPRGFSWRSGEIRAAHIGWSGNTRLYVERTNEGVSLLGG